MTHLSARAWVAGTVVVALLLLVASWFLLIGPVRAEAAELRDETVSVEQQNAALQARTAELRRQFASLPTEQQKLEGLQEALPSDVALPTLLRDISQYARQSGLTLMSVTPGTPAPVVDPAAAAAAAAPGPAPAEGGETAPAPVEGEEPASPDAAAPSTPAGPTTTAIPITTTVIGEFFDAQSFLRLLQTEMPRAYLVRDLSVTAEDGGDASGGRPVTMAGDVTLTITADVFARPSTLEESPTVLPTVPAPDATTPLATPAPGVPAPIAPEGPGQFETAPPAGDPQPTPGVPAPAGAPDAPPAALT